MPYGYLGASIDATKEASTRLAGSVGVLLREIGQWDDGRPKRYHGGSGVANGTSWISTAKLDGSRTLDQTCGIWGLVSPTSRINSLVRSGNSHVEAVMRHSFKGDVNNRAQIDAFIPHNTKH